MRCLCLDLARISGWALVEPNKPALSGSFTLIDRAMTENAGQVYASLEQHEADLIAVHQPQEVWIEAALQLHGRSLIAEAVLLGLAAVAELVAYKAGLPTFRVGVQDARQAVIGKRRGNKEDVAWWAYYLGYRPVDDNAADALVVGAYAAACAGYRLAFGPEYGKAKGDVFGAKRA